MDIFNFEQYSSEWWAIRQKKMTGSHAQAISANGAGLNTYITEIMTEYYSSCRPERYTNKDMERGLELEPEAATRYAAETLSVVDTVGFVVYSDFIGVSPDRFVSDDGLAEIKCPNDKTYFKLLLDFKIEKKYLWQMQMQMLCCDRAWCDYVVYNPNFDEDILIERVYPDEDMVGKLQVGFESGENMIKEIEEKMNNNQ